MLKTLAPEQALTLRNYFRECGYSTEGLKELLGTEDYPSRHLGNIPLLLHRAGTDTPLSILARLFYCGASVDAEEVDDLLPPDVLTALAGTGLVQSGADGFSAPFMMLPLEEHFLAMDHSTTVERGDDPNVILMLNPTTLMLYHAAIRRRTRRTLEVGTGCGAVGLAAALQSDQVVATDLNQRAVDVTRFNAWLNGLDNVDCRQGSLFEPVAGERFDVILSNPPFFITPDFESDLVFCQNPDQLDALCMGLLRAAPDHLEEGGWLQMLFEWVAVEGEPWQERLNRFVANSGCDVFLIVGAVQDPARYAHDRIRELGRSLRHARENAFADWMAYYRHFGVTAIYRGLIAMRRRSGTNWMRVVETGSVPKRPFGHGIEQAFAAQDFLRSGHAQEALLGMRFRLSPHARLQQRLEPRDGVWRNDVTEMVLTEGLPYTQKTEPLVAEFVAQFTGQYPLGQMTEAFSQRLGADAAAVRAQCLDLVLRLVERGYLTWETGAN